MFYYFCSRHYLIISETNPKIVETITINLNILKLFRVSIYEKLIPLTILIRVEQRKKTHQTTSENYELIYVSILVLMFK
jgi:hypothetical protein